MSTATTSRDAGDRLEAIDWSTISADLDAQGWAILPKLLSAPECDATAGRYYQRDGFRSHVVMARHGFDRGEYKYFAYPLPHLVEGLRTALYPHLAPIADRWHETMDRDERDLGCPIVSVSLGVSAVFLWGGQQRADRPRRVPLVHGDVVVWGGPARMTFHGVHPLTEGQHPLTGDVRYNLTFRRAA